jgi:hypothetical protein
MKPSAVKNEQGSSGATKPPERAMRTRCAGKEINDKITMSILQVNKVVKDAKLSCDGDGSKIALEFVDGSSFNVDILGWVHKITFDYLSLNTIPRENLDLLRNKKVEHIIVDPGNIKEAKPGFIIFICGGDKLIAFLKPGSIQRIESD